MNQTIGKRFPDLEMADQDGQVVKLSALAGGFPLILVFYRGYW
jgi:peroxiredoxin